MQSTLLLSVDKATKPRRRTAPFWVPLIRSVWELPVLLLAEKITQPKVTFHLLVVVTIITPVEIGATLRTSWNQSMSGPNFREWHE